MTEEDIKEVVTFVRHYQPCFNKTQDEKHPYYDKKMEPYYYGVYDRYSQITDNSKEYVDWEVSLYVKAYLDTKNDI